MGNSISKKLDEKYINNDFQVVNSKQDPLLGMFAVWKFQISREILCIHKICDPNQYDESSDIQSLTKNMFTEEKNICDFYLLKINKQNSEVYDFIFEYGNHVQLPFAKEKYVWILLEQISEAMIQIENKKLYYPFIHIEYIVQLEKKQFKMINPYCFTSFFYDVLKVCLNPMVKVSDKQQFQKKKIQQNIQQLGCLVVSILGNFNTSQIYNDILYRNQCIQFIQNNISRELLSFLKFVFYDLSKSTPVSFRQIKRFIENNKPKRTNKFVRHLFNNKKNTFNYYKPQQDIKQQTKQYFIFDSSKNLPKKNTVKDQLNVTPKLSKVQQKRSLPTQNLSTFYMDDFNFQHESQNQYAQQNTVKQNLFQNNFMNDPKFNKPIQKDQEAELQQEDNQHNDYQQQDLQKDTGQQILQQNEYEQNNEQDQYDNKQDVNFNPYQQGQNQYQEKLNNPNQTQDSDDEFFKKNTFSLQDGDKQQLNAKQENVQQQNKDDFFDIPETQKDQLEDPVDYFDKNAPFQKQNFFEGLQDENNIDPIYNDQPQQNKKDVKQVLFTQQPEQNNGTLDKLNSMGEQQSEEEPDQYYDDSSSQNSQKDEEIKSVKKNKVKEIFRFIAHEQTYKKFYVYDDGTEEEVQMNQQEENHFNVKDTVQKQQQNYYVQQQQSNKTENINQYFTNDLYANKSNQVQNNQNEASQNQNLFYSQYKQNNFMPDFSPPPNMLEDLDQTESIDITLMDKENNIHFILYPGEKINPQVLFRKKTQKNYNFENIEKVVDFQNKIKPSMYHQVEVDDRNFQQDPITDPKECISKINPSLKGTLKSRQTLIKSKFQLMIFQLIQTCRFSIFNELAQIIQQILYFFSLANFQVHH